MSRRPRRQYYGWFDRTERVYRLTLYAPDAPVRPAVEYQNRSEVNAVLEKKRSDVYWWPPLPQDAP